MKRRNGFTLIELLAIIIILAIIAVITIPVVLNVIDNAKKEGAIDSAQGYKKAIDQYYLNKMMLDDDYDVLDDDISMMDSKYKKDDVQIRVVCNNKERELCYSDEVIMNMKLAWRKQLHLWSSKKVSDSTLIKRAISPRTFFIIYRLCTGEYILGGPSYKIIENLPAGVIRIDNSNYHEADGIPLKPQDCEYTLFDNNTCSKVDIDRVIAIYETPKGPQVWYCGNIDGNRISQLESFCQ